MARFKTVTAKLDASKYQYLKQKLKEIETITNCLL